METRLITLLQDKGQTVHSVSPKDSVYDCAVKMNQLRIGAVLVLENGQLKGLLSERDVVSKMIACGCNLVDVQVADVMTKKLTTVSLRTTVNEAIQIVTEKRIRHLPVVEEDKLLGIISIGDLTRWIMLWQQDEISSLTRYIQGAHA